LFLTDIHQFGIFIIESDLRHQAVCTVIIFDDRVSILILYPVAFPVQIANLFRPLSLAVVFQLKHCILFGIRRGISRLIGKDISDRILFLIHFALKGSTLDCSCAAYQEYKCHNQY